MKHTYSDEQATAAAEQYMAEHPLVDWNLNVVVLSLRNGFWVATGHHPCWLCEAFEESAS